MAEPRDLQIHRDDLSGPEIRALLEEHLAEMRRISPPESVHAMDLDRLKRPEVTFWTVWQQGRLVGCGALKELTPEHGEIKSMRTALGHQGGGIGTAMLRHLLAEADRRGYHRVSLETGSQPHFEPARHLYRRHGFVPCGPFGDYREDPNSAFFTRLVPPTLPGWRAR